MVMQRIQTNKQIFI